MNGSGIIIYYNGSEPLGITIDFVYERLYWTDSTGRVWEGAYDGSLMRVIYFNDIFVPFQIATVRNFVLVTSQINESYALIDRDDFSVALIGTPPNTSYYGVSVVSKLKQPSQGEFVLC